MVESPHKDCEPGHWTNQNDMVPSTKHCLKYTTKCCLFVKLFFFSQSFGKISNKSSYSNNNKDSNSSNNNTYSSKRKKNKNNTRVPLARSVTTTTTKTTNKKNNKMKETGTTPTAARERKTKTRPGCHWQDPKL